MKRFLISLLAMFLVGNLAGCSSSSKSDTGSKNDSNQESSSEAKQDTEIFQIDFEIDQEKTEAFEQYCLNDREDIGVNDIVTYGKSGTGYIKRYTIYADDSVGMETYCNYRDDENGKRICDSMIIYVNSDQSIITMQTSKDSTIYYTELTDSIHSSLNLITKDEFNTLLDSATDFAAGVNDSGEEECFQVTYKDTNYLFYDYSYVNAEYDNTYTYSIDLGEYEGFLSIEKADENNQDTTCNIADFSTFTHIDEKEFMDMYNGFEE